MFEIDLSTDPKMPAKPWAESYRIHDKYIVIKAKNKNK